MPGAGALPIPRSVRGEWDALTARATSPDAVFTHSSVDALPDPAQRWLRHSIAEGTPLWTLVELEMTGEIRLNNTWRKFSARQVLAPNDGFIWAAHARVGGLTIRGFDRYTSGTGEMRWKLGGLVPVMTSTGSDVTRSARGRLAGESVLVPTCFPTAGWQLGPLPDTVSMTRSIDGEGEDVQLTVSGDGSLSDGVMRRWGNPDGRGFGRFPFGVTVTSENTYHGVKIPSVFSAGWWHGTDREEEGEFFRAAITAATFR